jgi:hypothetical protein
MFTSLFYYNTKIYIVELLCCFGLIDWNLRNRERKIIINERVEIKKKKKKKKL